MNEPGNTTQLLVDSLMITHRENAARHRQQVIEEACAAHPDAADALRARLRILQEAGMLGPLEGPGTDTTWSAKDRAAISDQDAAATYNPVGPYQPLKELGRGGQAVVYLAEDLRLNRPVALKVLKGLGPLSETTMRRFRREAEVASRLDHPGICAVYDAGVRDKVPFIAMRFVEGESLARHITRTRKQRSSEKQIRLEGEETSTHHTSRRDTTTRILQVIEKAARALHVAHEAGIIHRDVKPGNILVTPAGEPVLVDFGLAGDEDGGGITLTATGEMPGTPAYMSPEQLAFERIRVDRRTDVYSLGVTLFECLTLEPPFRAATREAMVQAIQHRAPADARKLNPALPTDLKVVLETALEKDRDRRYQSALDLAEDLRRVREGKPITAKPVGMIGRMLRYARRRPARAALILMLVLGLPVVTGMGGYIVAHQPEIARQKEQALAEEVERQLMAGYDELSMKDFDEPGLGDPQRATAAFDAALELQHGCAEAVAGKALVLLWQQKAEACLGLLDAHPALEENVPALRGIRVDALREFGKKEEAADLEAAIPPPKTALEHYLEGSRLLLGRPNILHHPGAVRQAMDHLTRAAFTAPNARILYHSKLADSVMRLAEATPARQVAKALTTLWPEQPEAWFWAGCALVPVDREESLLAIRQMVRLRPDSYFAHKHLGYHLQNAGLFDEAIAAHQKAIELKPDRGGAYYGLGCAYAKKGCFDAAVAAFEKAIALRVEFAYLYYELGVSLTEMGKLDAANASFMKAVELDPKLLKIYVYVYCDRIRIRGKLDTALTLLKKALELRPEYADIHVGIGQALADKGELDRAIATFKKALELQPDLVEAHRGLAGAYRKIGALDKASRAFEKAITVYRKALELDPGNNCTRNSLALFLLESGRAEEAIPILEKAIRLDPGNSMSHSNLGSAFGRMGKWDKAIAAYRKAIELDPTGADAYCNLGAAYQSKGFHDEAIAVYRKAIELDPAFAGAYNNLGVVLVDTDQLDKAIDAFNKAIELDPTDAEAYFNLGNAYKSKGLLKEAIDSCEKAIELNPTFAKAYSRLGAFLGGTGQLDEAIDAFNKAIELDSTYAEAYYNLGSAFIHKGKLDKAIDAFNKVIKLDPTYAEAYYNLGIVLRGSGRLDEAISAFRKAIEYEPTKPTAYNNLGVVLVDKGKWVEAIDAFNRAIELDPTLALAYLGLGNAFVAMGQLDKAIDAYEKAIELKPDLPHIHCGLGVVYSIKGEHMKALHHIHRYHALGSKRKARGNLPKSLLRQTEKSVLRMVLREDVVSEDADECVPVASLLAKYDYHLRAARFWRDALEEEPEHTEALSEDCWYLAARSAALAGCGKGRDARDLDEAACAAWRQQALAWLRKALTARKEKLEARSLTPKALRKTLSAWRSDSHLTGLRDPEGLATLSPAERQDWQAFWAAVKALQDRPKE